MIILAVETHRHKSIGTYLRCASAFGADTVIVVGSPMYSTHGAHGAQNHVDIVHFYYWKDCIEFCRERDCKLYAVSPSILEDNTCKQRSVSVDTFKFDVPNACFIIGQKDGLTTEQMEISDAILHVEVPLSDYASKIVYDSKLAICLQQFAATTCKIPRGFENEKHVLGELNFRRPRTIKAGRKNARAAAAESNAVISDPGLEEPLDNLFS